MNRPAFRMRVAFLAVVVLLALVVAGPAGAFHLSQVTPEPTPRPTADPVAYLELDPVQGPAGDATQVKASGGLWEPGHTLTLYWDDASVPPGVLLGSTQILGDGTFELTFTTPVDPAHATVGVHRVIAVATDATVAEAGFELTTATPTPTYTPSPTFTPSPLPYITLNPTETVGGRKLSVQVNGFYWPADGRGVTLYWDVRNEDHRLLGPFQPNPVGTFQVTVTVKKAWATPGTHTIIAWDNREYATNAAIELLEPTPTLTPEATTTFTPSPTLRPVTPMVTITPLPPTKAPPRTPAATRTNTPVPGTATVTSTPSVTPTPTHTPGPGTPSATPLTEAAQPTATPEDQISDTGGGWGMVFLWGFVLAGLLVVFRLLRVRSS